MSGTVNRASVTRNLNGHSCQGEGGKTAVPGVVGVAGVASGSVGVVGLDLPGSEVTTTEGELGPCDMLVKEAEALSHVGR